MRRVLQFHIIDLFFYLNLQNKALQAVRHKNSLKRELCSQTEKCLYSCGGLNPSQAYLWFLYELPCTFQNCARSVIQLPKAETWRGQEASWVPGAEWGVQGQAAQHGTAQHGLAQLSTVRHGRAEHQHGGHIATGSSSKGSAPQSNHQHKTGGKKVSQKVKGWPLRGCKRRRRKKVRGDCDYLEKERTRGNNSEAHERKRAEKLSKESTENKICAQ